MSTELVTQQPTPPALARAIASPKDLIERHKELAVIINETFTKGVDFGVIPGTGTKPVLLKPGAERMCIAFGASPQYECVVADIDHDYRFEWVKRSKYGDKRGESVGRYRFIYKCKIVRFDGRHLGEGEGSCSTLESKFCDRPRDLENTVIKMAQKRALVAAVLNAFGLSDRFTQDVEDFDDHEQETGTKAAKAPHPSTPPSTTFNARDKGDIEWLKIQPDVQLMDHVTQKKVALELHGHDKATLESAIKRVEASMLEEIKAEEASLS